MKYLVLLAALIALPATAQQRPELTPEQKWNAFNAVTALAVGWFVLPAATLTGNKEGLCTLMEGKYDPTASDQCAGGQWANVALFLKSKKEQPK